MFGVALKDAMDCKILKKNYLFFVFERVCVCNVAVNVLIIWVRNIIRFTIRKGP